MHCELYSRLERFIECADAIGCKNEDTLIVFQDTEKHGYQCITLQICLRALLEEDIGFIEEDHTTPDGPNIEYRFQILLYTLGIGANVAAGDPVKRPLRKFGHALGCERLSCA